MKSSRCSAVKRETVDTDGPRFQGATLVLDDVDPPVSRRAEGDVRGSTPRQTDPLLDRAVRSEDGNVTLPEDRYPEPAVLAKRHAVRPVQVDFLVFGIEHVAEQLTIADRDAVLDSVAEDVAGVGLVRVQQPVGPEGDAVGKPQPAIEEPRLSAAGIEAKDATVDRQVHPVLARLAVEQEVADQDAGVCDVERAVG